MGFFSKLLGFDSDDEKIRNVYTDLSDMLRGTARKKHTSASSFSPAPQPSASPSAGCSRYGMPDEDCQYNYNGTYTEYFDDLFHREFPEYDIEYREEKRYHPATVFTFRQNGQIALIVELLSEKSSVRKLRSECSRSNIPYLRYYYNHDGWWNTRSYVTQRTRNALRG